MLIRFANQTNFFCSKIKDKKKHTMLKNIHFPYMFLIPAALSPACRPGRCVSCMSPGPLCRRARYNSTHPVDEVFMSLRSPLLRQWRPLSSMRRMGARRPGRSARTAVVTLRERCPVDGVGRQDTVHEGDREGRVFPGVHAALVDHEARKQVAVEPVQLLDLLDGEIPRRGVVVHHARRVEANSPVQFCLGVDKGQTPLSQLNYASRERIGVAKKAYDLVVLGVHAVGGPAPWSFMSWTI